MRPVINPELKKLVGNNVRYLRSSIGKTQTEYAALFKKKNGAPCERTNIDSYETGLALCPPFILEQIAKYHKVSTVDIKQKVLSNNPGIGELRNLSNEKQTLDIELLESKDAIIEAQQKQIKKLQNLVKSLQKSKRVG